jgi:phage terminase Nu1 subunit (DNA packaging protein)
MADEEITAIALAKLIGVEQRTVRRLSQEGVVVRSKRGRYLRDASVRAYCECLRSAAAGRSDSEALTGERVRLVKLQADRAELDLAERRNELFAAAEVKDIQTKIARAVRGVLLALPARIGSRVPALSVRDVSRIDDEVRDALTELSGG